LVNAADHIMRRALHELESLRAATERNAVEVRALREKVRGALAENERRARAHVNAFAPIDLGAELRSDLRWFVDLPKPRQAEALPRTFDEARNEWENLSQFASQDVRDLVAKCKAWERRLIKSRRSMPTLSDDLWITVQRLSEIHAALPDLRERYVADQIDAAAHLNADLAAEIAKRNAKLDEAYAGTRRLLAEVEESLVTPAASAWNSASWSDAVPAEQFDRVIRIGDLDPNLPQDAGIGRVPALLQFPFKAGVAIEASVENRQTAVDLARSLILRTFAATPPGDIRFVMIDPVSIGQSVADFRHLAEFDPRLVDTKTWTSERDIEARLEELSDHLEVVISTYLRGQFESVDEYNREAGEVAEPYRTVVVFDYPTGFTSRSARQLLSLIENGPRCGVHTILVYDPARKAPDEISHERLTHSMQAIDLNRHRVTMPAPLDAVTMDFRPDACPPISFSADGRATSPFGQMLLNIGAACRSTDAGHVTLERVIPIVNKQIGSERSRQVPQVHAGSPVLDPGDDATWWSGISARGAYAPIGRAGAQDVAAMYFSSTEIAGGSIVVGLPRSGKSTALHAAIVSMSMIYSPDELELYLVDSKHGVEFKIYDRLPHARLVSINSEREFSVSVLRSLDGEIKRRAELMKQHTAGKTNITEYRTATGEHLPRIVLFMDEFHELFEDDDALGQAAFQAFSNIVRQGPFAGVHVVVASQTISSMPAMDRSTLALLPMRIAFPCNDADADLVMGDTNREVKALSQQGQGIFNPARGEPSRNQPFRGMYVEPDERDVLLRKLASKAATSGFERLPRVFDGDTLAARATPTDGSATRPTFALGEPFDLDPWAALTLRRGRGANILLVGADSDDDADSAVDGAVQSCLADAAVERLVVEVVDFIGDPETTDGSLDLMTLCAALAVSYRRASALGDVLVDLEAEVAARQDASDYGRDAQLLVLNGLQRALELSPEDPYADPDIGGGAEAARALARVLRDGPEVGCHVVAVVDRLAQFDRRLGRDMLKEFDWRIAGSDTGSADIAALTEVFTEAEIRRSQLLVIDQGRGRSRRVRGYPKHTAGSVPATIDRSAR
jgi:DNA segregation ATPase FtsK/SpoIIIE, S-DNA-T family